MEKIKIYNYKQIKETFKELRVSKETFKNLEYKYIPIKENSMVAGWGEPSCLEAIDTIIGGVYFDSADEAENFYYNNYNQIYGIDDDADIDPDEYDGIYGVPVTPNNEIVFIQ